MEATLPKKVALPLKQMLPDSLSLQAVSRSSISSSMSSAGNIDARLNGT